MLKLDFNHLQRAQHVLLFTVFWLNFSPILSFTGGILLFIFLMIFSELALNVLKSFPYTRCLSVFLPAFLLLAFRALMPLISLFPYPLDLSLLTFYQYLFPIAVSVSLMNVLLCGTRVKASFRISSVLLYAVLLSLMMSQKNWNFNLLDESLLLTYLLFSVFILLELFMLLSSQSGQGRLSFPGLFTLLFIPVSVLFLLNHNQSRESLKQGGGLMKESLFRFDFADYLSLESSISMKDDLVFMMKSGARDSEYYIRRYVLADYSEEQGFFREDKPVWDSPRITRDILHAGEWPFELKLPDYEMTEVSHQEYYYVNFESSAFLAMNSPKSYTPYQLWDDSSFSRIYAVESSVSTSWPWDLMGSDPPGSDNDSRTRDFLDYYTYYEEADDLKDLASEIVDGEQDYYEKVLAIERFFHEEFFYSLKPGEARDGDQLRYFLFDSRKGYCSYFAFAMTLLCRTQGIPARVALGFWLDGDSGTLGYYPVKANQAHAWVEVYFPDFGWIEFDPTSSIPAPGETFDFTQTSVQEMEPYIKEILDNRDDLRALKIPDEESAQDSSAGAGGFALLVSNYAFIFCIIFILCLSLFLLIRYLLLERLSEHKERIRTYFYWHLILTEGCFSSDLPQRDGISLQDYIVLLKTCGSHRESVSLLVKMAKLYESLIFASYPDPAARSFDLHTLWDTGLELRKGLKSAGVFKYRLYLIKTLSFLKGRAHA